jgi:hypothetical protein
MATMFRPQLDKRVMNQSGRFESALKSLLVLMPKPE